MEKELMEDDEVEFVKEWSNISEIAWSKDSKRLTESQKMSIIAIKKKLIKNVVRFEPAPSTSATDPLGPERVLMLKCCLCFELFYYEADLKAHVASFHSDAKKKRAPKTKPPPCEPATASYQCDKCTKMFSRRRNFIQHYRRLHDSSWFKCRKCSRTFRKKEDLCAHVSQQNDCANDNRTKNIVAMFSCKYCTKPFSRNYYMTRHVRNVHESVPVNCQVCTKIFSCNDNLKRHHARIHRS